MAARLCGVRSDRKGTMASMLMWKLNVYVEYRTLEASAWICLLRRRSEGMVWRRCVV